MRSTCRANESHLIKYFDVLWRDIYTYIYIYMKIKGAFTMIILYAVIQIRLTYSI